MKSHIKLSTQQSRQKEKQTQQTTQSLQNLSNLLLVLDNHQNTLQTIRQTLTLRPQFNPQTLFKYLCGNQKELSKKHIMMVLQENGEYLHEQQLKIIFTIAGCKDKMSFSSFLNYIYPYNVQTLKQIATVNAKKYAKNGNDALTQDILCLFIMAIRGQINFLHDFQAAKAQTLPKISRQKIKKLVKAIKKISESTKINSQLPSDNVITHQEMKNFLKKMKTPQNRLNSICRKLSMNKDEGFISLQQFQFWIRPWNKIKTQDGGYYEKQNQQKSLLEDISPHLEIEV